MKRNIALSVLLFVFALSTNAFAQSAKEAVYALKKLQVQVQTGISYREYSPAVAEAKFPVKLYLESPEAQNTPQLSEALKNAVNHYDFANTVWGYKFSGQHVHYFIYDSPDKDFFNEIVSNYPDMPISQEGGLFGPGRAKIDIDDAISLMWKKASLEIKNASDLLAKAETTKVEEKTITQSKDDTQKQIDSLKKEIEKLKKENKSLKKQLEAMKAKSN